MTESLNFPIATLTQWWCAIKSLFWLLVWLRLNIIFVYFTLAGFKYWSCAFLIPCQSTKFVTVLPHFVSLSILSKRGGWWMFAAILLYISDSKTFLLSWTEIWWKGRRYFHYNAVIGFCCRTKRWSGGRKCSFDSLLTITMKNRFTSRRWDLQLSLIKDVETR